jgi:hypothetical protein
MSLSMMESLAVSSLAKHLYEFLPASGNTVTAFPIAAHQAGIAEAWPNFRVSKLPGITHMLTWTLENRRDRLSSRSTGAGTARIHSHGVRWKNSIDSWCRVVSRFQNCTRRVS